MFILEKFGFPFDIADTRTYARKNYKISLTKISCKPGVGVRGSQIPKVN